MNKLQRSEKFGLKDDTDVDSIVKSKRSRWQKELEEEKNEAARLAKLSEEERQQALIQKEKDDFEKEKAVFRQEQLLVEKGNNFKKSVFQVLLLPVFKEILLRAIKDVKSLKLNGIKLEAAVNKNSKLL
ncbi:DUF4355 domain-containing protein [Lactococcus cremoris]